MSTPATSPGVPEQPHFVPRQPVYAIAGLLAIACAPFVIWPTLASRVFATNFLPHRYCYLGTPALVWTHVVADSLIGIAYFAISGTLAYLIYKGHRDIPFHWMLLAFGLFIVACGGTHLMEVVTVWIPVYVLSGGIKVFTALVSVVTAVLLPFTVPRILALVQTAKASEAAEGRFRELLETAPDAMVITQKEGRIVLVNSQTEKLFGYARQELLGKSGECLIPDRFHKLYVDRREQFFGDPHARGMEAGLELHARRKNGDEFPVEISLSPLQTVEGLLVTAAIRDISQRKQAETELALANERLRLAMGAGKSVGWDWNVKSGQDSWFGDLKTMFGMPSDTYSGHIEDFRRRIHPDDRGLVSKAADDAIQGHRPYAAEFRVVWPDGTVRWVAAKGKFHYSTDGEAERMVGMATDITERRHAEESLRLFRKLIDESNDAIEVIDPQTLRFLDVNEKACRDLGYTRNELLSLKVPDIDPAFNESLFARVRKEFEQSGYVIFDSLHQRKDGSVYPVEVNVKLVELDLTYAVAVVRDTTERKRIEEGQRQRDADLSEAQRLAQVGSWQWDPEKDTVIWSEELYRISGRDPSLAAPNYREHSKLYTVESWERLRHVVDEALRSGAAYEVDLEMILLDGTTKWVRGRGEAQCDAAGRVVRLRGTAQDITERKLAEQALSRVNRKLIEAQEQERTRIARELHDDISQRLVLLTLALEQMKQRPLESVDELRSGIDELQKQTSDLSSDVQTLSHELHSSKLEHLGMVVAMRSFCKELSKQKKVEIDFKQTDVPGIMPRETSLCLFRVLQEGLHNAVKHSGARHFEVDLRGSSNALHLTIRDSGFGFDPAAAMQGRGLGLVSMEERMKLVDGGISINTQTKQGTTIHAWAPLSSGSSSMRAAG